jgi:hypothetical protein
MVFKRCSRALLASLKLLILWSGRPGSNRRHSAWEADVLPLNYSRREVIANVMKYILTPDAKELSLKSE